jgi:hypothetical protein
MSLLLAFMLFATNQARAIDFGTDAYQMPNCTAPVLNPVQYNCDGSVTISWASAPGANTYSADIVNPGGPILDFANMTDTFFTVVPGSLSPGTDYTFAVTSECGNSTAASNQGVIEGDDIQNLLPVLSVEASEGTSCPDAADGMVMLVVNDQSCGATYSITVGGITQSATSGNFVTFNNLTVGSYTATIALDDPGMCNLSSNCVDGISTEFSIASTDNEMPSLDITSNIGITPPATATFNLPEGECGFQFLWFITTSDNCNNPQVSATIQTTTNDAAVFPGGSVNLINTGDAYVLEGFAAIGTNTLTITSSDEDGNLVTAEFEIEVVDNRPPVFQGPGSLLVETPSCNNEVPVNWSVIAIDDCDIDPNITQTQGPASGSYLTPGIYTVGYEAFDDYGNTATYSFDITVVQGESPAPIVDVSGNTQYTVAACETEAFAVFSGNIFDCNITPGTNVLPDIQVTGAPLNAGYTNVQSGFAYFELSGFLSPGFYGVNVSYQGVEVSNILLEVVQDADTPAEVVLPGNLTYALPYCHDSLWVNMQVQISDDCDEVINANNLMTTLNGDALDFNPDLSEQGNYTYSILLTPELDDAELLVIYEDEAGNITEAVNYLSISHRPDTIAPTIVYPNQSLQQHLNACAESLTEVCFQVKAIDDCTGEVTPLIQLIGAGGSLFPVTNTNGNTYCADLNPGHYTVNVLATDEYDNTRQESFSINITQDTAQLVNLACNDQLNVVTDTQCQRLITPDMLLDGNFGCLTDDDFEITINDADPTNGNILDGHGLFPYEIELAPGVDAGTGFIPCWGYLNGIDNKAPVLTAPANTDEAIINSNGFTLSGTLSAGMPTLNVPAYICLNGLSSNGTRYYNLQTVEVNADGFYTFLVSSDFADGLVAMALFEGSYSPSNPCQNIVAEGTNLSGITGTGIPYIALNVWLNGGTTYTLLTSSQQPEQTGNYTYTILADGPGQAGLYDTTFNSAMSETVTFTPFALSPVTYNQPLFCEDLDSLLNNPNSLQYTGSPVIEDNCGEVTLTFEDTYSEIGGDCGSIVITRTFEATDAAGNSSTTVQLITLQRPDPESDVSLPPNNIPIDCQAVYETLPNGYPSPTVTGYPYINTIFGAEELDFAFCDVAATFQDGTRIPLCEGAYKFVRVWQIFDWCDMSTLTTYQQWIKVGDFSAPVVTAPDIDYDGDGEIDMPVFSNSQFSCEAAFEVPLPVVEENCSDYEVHTAIVEEVIDSIFGNDGQLISTETDTLVVRTISWNAPNRIVSGIPIGNYYFRYTVTDGCGNSATEYFPFVVEDNVLPTAVCDQNTVVAIGGLDYGRIYAEDIDNGSWDNCGVENFAVRRNGINNQTGSCGNDFSNFGPYVDFFCCDAGELIMVELRVVDLYGNINTCMVQVVPEELAAPECVAPADVTIDCTDLPAGFDAEDTATLEELFGTATANDNCSATATELTPIVNMNCGAGTILRRFNATDGSGNVSGGDCQQLITIPQVHNYEIRFPADIASVCGATLTDTVTYTTLGCDLLAVSSEDEIFEPSNGECYKIYRTWRVMNWCQYDGVSDPFVVSRDPDCDTENGEEAVFVLNRPDGFTYIDRDNDETEPNNNPLASENLCQGFDDYWQRADYNGGFYEYTQVISVFDEAAPIVNFSPVSPFCSIDNETCEGPVSYSFNVSDDCVMGTANNDILQVRVFLDAGNDGTLDIELTLTDMVVVNFPDYQISGSFPIGSHRFEVQVSDGCGNSTVESLPFEVIDCATPALSCLNGLAVELDAYDSDGDGAPDSGIGDVWADDFVIGDLTDCSGEISYSINRVGDQPNVDSTGIYFSCADTGLVMVEVYAWDPAGNSSSCETFLFVQDNDNVCSGGQPTAAAGGTIETPAGAYVEEVEISLSGQNGGWLVTGADGSFTFEGLTPGQDYTVTPTRDGDDLNGVSTFDLLLMNKHILGIQPFSTPYQIIAADVNNSGNVSTLDMITLRKLILGDELEFTNNSSWRFVEADYIFPNPSDPWAEQFPEVLNINDIPQAGISNADFVAIKIGDVNGDAQPNNLTGIDERNFEGTFVLNLEDRQLETDEEYTIYFTSEHIKSVGGYQGTLFFDDEALEILDVMPGRMESKYIGTSFTSHGMVTLSWNKSEDELADYFAPNDVLFSISVRAKSGLILSEVMRTNSRVTIAEAYSERGDLYEFGLEFYGHINGANANDRFELHQNYPNPFRDETVIGFELPEATSFILTVSDISGRVVKTIEQEGQQGYNAVNLDKGSLPEGMLQYTLQAGTHIATKRMMILAD